MADASALIADLRQRADDIVRSAGDAVVDELRSTAPRRTGYLAESVGPPASLQGGDTYGVIVTVEADYASFVNDGTAPHVIEGNPLLAFEWNGSHVIVHSVHHPGTAPTNWATDVFERWGEFLAAAQ